MAIIGIQEARRFGDIVRGSIRPEGIAKALCGQARALGVRHGAQSRYGSRIWKPIVCSHVGQLQPNPGVDLLPPRVPPVLPSDSRFPCVFECSIPRVIAVMSLQAEAICTRVREVCEGRMI